jgi:AcrR family transcriptional regulator
MPHHAPREERERLLHAARTAWERAGTHGLKLDNVLQLAGVSTRAFYRCFAHKDDLLRALAQEHFDALVDHSRDVFARAATPLDGLRTWVEQTLDVDRLGGSQRSAAALDRHWLDLRVAYPEETAAMVTAVHQVLADALRQMRDSGLPHVRPSPDAAAILMLINAVRAQRLLGPPQVDLDLAVKIVWPFVTRSLLLEVTPD